MALEFAPTRARVTRASPTTKYLRDKVNALLAERPSPNVRSCASGRPQGATNVFGIVAKQERLGRFAAHDPKSEVQGSSLPAPCGATLTSPSPTHSSACRGALGGPELGRKRNLLHRVADREQETQKLSQVDAEGTSPLGTADPEQTAVRPQEGRALELRHRSERHTNEEEVDADERAERNARSATKTTASSGRALNSMRGLGTSQVASATRSASSALARTIPRRVPPTQMAIFERSKAGDAPSAVQRPSA
jgi:hypothetical protein